jgi:YidC/Oxa1 family membrane protein insertase
VITIYKFLGSILLFFCEKFGNYGWAILAFGLIVKIIMLPFQMKSKKSMMKTTTLTPLVKELEKRHKGNPQKYQEEVNKLYRNAGVNPMSGCLWTLIPFPIIIILYRVVRQPLSIMMSLAAEEIETLTKVVTDLGYYVEPTGRNAAFYSELHVADALHRGYEAVKASGAVSAFADRLANINFNFLGLNLTETPRLVFWANGVTLAGFVLFLIPFLSAGLSWLQMALAQRFQPAQSAQQAQSTKTMNLMMPLMSIWICFTMPAMMGLYWVEQSVLAIIQEEILNRIYKKQIDDEMAEFVAKEKAKEEELERKRAETERRRAEGRQQQNANTSKKRLAAQEKNAEEQRQAALRAADRAAKGIVDEVPESQVGTRRYARGRAYMSDRFEAEEESVPAAEESGEESKE